MIGLGGKEMMAGSDLQTTYTTLTLLLIHISHALTLNFTKLYS